MSPESAARFSSPPAFEESSAAGTVAVAPCEPEGGSWLLLENCFVASQK